MTSIVVRREIVEANALRVPSTTTIAGTIFDGENVLEKHVVAFQGDTISAVVPEFNLGNPTSDHIDLNGAILMPGFIDIQVNGGGGVLFNDHPTPRSIARIGAAHRQFGTVGFLPTLITDTYSAMRRAIKAVERAIDLKIPGVLGIHLEGPFLGPERPGVHDACLFRRLDPQGFRLVTSLKKGITVLTLAPEQTDPETISALANAGVIVCAGHSAADYDQARAATAAGVTGFTHLFNAMTPPQSRAPGMIGAAVESKDAWFGIIADGHHMHPAMFRMAVRAKQRGGAVLVTDAMPSVGSQLRQFQLGGKRIQVRAGRCITTTGGLAGSHLDMISAVSNASRFADIDWFEAARMASLYPAKALGMQDRLGRIKPGYRASFVAVDDNRNIKSVWVDGNRYDA